MKDSLLLVVLICSSLLFNACGSSTSQRTLDIATHLFVTAPSAAPVAGTAFTVTVSALDASNSVVSSYSGTVHFTSSDAQAVLPADSKLNNGSGPFSVTFKTSGPQTVTVADAAGVLTAGTSGSVNVSPGATTQFSVTAPTTATAGTAFTFTVTAQDASKNTTVAYTGNVHFTSSDHSAVLPADSPLTSGAGTKSFSATLNAGGPQTITATDTAAASITGISNPIALPAITVSVAPLTATVALGATAPFIATVTNEGTSSNNVTWTVSCAAASCGSVLPATTATSAATTYTAPTAPPAGNLTVTLTATSVADPTKTGAATITVTGITVSVAPPTASVPSGGTLQFTPTVNNDPSNRGVTWSLKLSYLCLDARCGGYGRKMVPCGASCGTISSTGTASGTPTNYTAPATPPRFPSGSCCGEFVFLVATSVANAGASSHASITVLPISVTVSPTSDSVAVNTTQQFTAAVTNDGTNSGVTWTLTQIGVACAPGCGTVSPVNTASAAPTTYTPPAVAPAFPLVTLTATSVADGTKSASAALTVTTASGAACGAGSGSESMLKGQYAFMLEGSDPLGVVAMAGSFSADGTGKVSTGEKDVNRNVGNAPFDVSIAAAGSSYAVGSDHRGCVILKDANGVTTYFRFALGAINASNIATKGHIIEFVDLNGRSTRVAGTLRLQDPTSFQASQFKGSYVVGLVGQLAPRFAAAGTLTTDGVSSITAGSFDFNNNGTLIGNDPFTPGTPYACCSSNGRGTLQIHTAGFTGNIAFYMINRSDAFLVNTDFGEYAGEAIGIPSGTTLTQASLTGASVIRETAQSTTGPVVDIATASANGTGALTVTDNVNSAGTFTSTTTALNYIVAANGRVTVSGGSTPPVIYLYGPNQGFLVGTDPNVEFGIIESQSAGPFTNASFTGAYTLGTENPSAPTVTLESGVLTSNGSGKATGTSDQSSSAGLTQNQALNFTYSIPANGTGNVGSNTTAILISGNKLVFINNTSATPTITVVDK